MEEKIINILKEVLETEDITLLTSQNNCENWDSLHHLSIVVGIETAFGVTLEPEEIAEMKSVKDIEDILGRKM